MNEKKLNHTKEEENLSIFLYISGDDDSFAVVTFEDEFNPYIVYEDMISKGEKKTILTSKDGASIYVSILNFKAVDNDFIDFVKDTFFDYDETKHKNIIRIK